MGNNNVNTRQQLVSLLSEGLVVEKIFGNKRELIDSLMFSRGKANVLYGETYDSLGITVDSLKYFLFLEYLARLVGREALYTVIEGDLHSVINPSVSEKDALLSEGKSRMGQIKTIFQILGIFQVKVSLMSEIFEKKNITKLIIQTTQLIKDRQDLQEQLAPTVLSNRVSQEKKSGFQYAAEAIGLALYFDLKVGPPREGNYDGVAQLVAQELGVGGYRAIYLRPSYPFTDDFSLYLTHPEIEEYGLTPYKAGSNKLQHQRIVIGKTSTQEIEKLVLGAYVPAAIVDASPLVDIASIVEMSEQIKQNRIDVRGMGEGVRKMVGDRDVLLRKLTNLIGELI